MTDRQTMKDEMKKRVRHSPGIVIRVAPGGAEAVYTAMLQRNPKKRLLLEKAAPLREARARQPEISEPHFYNQMNEMLGREVTSWCPEEVPGYGRFALGGREHDVLAACAKKRVFKITKHGSFGLIPVVDSSSETGYRLEPKTLRDGLPRVNLSNAYFGDQMQIENMYDKDSPIIFSQPLIVGTSPSNSEIADAMGGLGFERVEGMDFKTWYHRADRVAAFDAHPGNFVRTSDGIVLPIDLIILRPEDELRGEIEKRL